MRAWVCKYCHALLRAESEPEACDLCGRKNRDNFTEADVPEQKPDEFSEKYEESLETLEQYAEGTEPEKRQPED